MMSSHSDDDTGSPPTPPAPSALSSSPWDHIDTSGCLPTPTQRSPVMQKLRGAQWATSRPRRLSFRDAQNAAPLFRTRSPSTEPADRRDPSPPSQDLSPVESISDTQNRTLLESLFPEFDSGTKQLPSFSPPESPLPPAPQPTASQDLPRIVTHAKNRVPAQLRGVLPNDDEEIDELKTPSPSPDQPQKTASNESRSSSGELARSKRSIPYSRASRINVKGVVRSHDWRVFKEAVGVVETPAFPPASYRDQYIPLKEQEGEEEGQEARTPDPPQTGPACHTRSSMRDRRDEPLEDMFAQHRFFDEECRASPPRTRNKAKRAQATIRARVHVDDDIPVPPLHYYEAQAYEQDISQQLHEVDIQPRAAENYKDREDDRPIKRERLPFHCRSRKTGKAFVYEAVIPNPRYDLDDPLPGHRALHFGYLVPDPRQQTSKSGAKPRKEYNLRRHQTHVLGQIDQTSFKPTKRSRSYADLDFADNNDNRAASPPPSPHSIRKPLGELRAGIFVQHIADEQAYSPGRDADGERSSPIVPKAKRAKKVDAKTQRLKGYSALAIGPALPERVLNSQPTLGRNELQSTQAETPSRLEQSKQKRKEAREARSKGNKMGGKNQLATKLAQRPQAPSNDIGPSPSSLALHMANLPMLQQNHGLSSSTPPRTNEHMQVPSLPQDTASNAAPVFEVRTRPVRKLSTLASTQSAVRKLDRAQTQVSIAGKPFRRAMDIDPYQFRLPESKASEAETPQVSETVPSILAGPSRTYTPESRRNAETVSADAVPNIGRSRRLDQTIEQGTTSGQPSSLSGPRILAQPSRTYTAESRQQTTNGSAMGNLGGPSHLAPASRHVRSVTDVSMETDGSSEDMALILAGPSRTYTPSSKFAFSRLSLAEEEDESGSRQATSVLQGGISLAQLFAPVPVSPAEDHPHPSSGDMPMQELSHAEEIVDRMMESSSPESITPQPSNTPPPPPQQPLPPAGTYMSNGGYWNSEQAAQESYRNLSSLSRRNTHVSTQYQPRTPSPMDDSPPSGEEPENLVTVFSKTEGAYGRQHINIPQSPKARKPSENEPDSQKPVQQEKKRRVIRQDQAEPTAAAV